MCIPEYTYYNCYLLLCTTDVNAGNFFLSIQAVKTLLMDIEKELYDDFRICGF